MKNYLKIILGPCLLALFISLYPAKATEVKSLIENQKFAEALKLVEKKISERKSGKKDQEWGDLIVEEALLKIALHGYETAVKDLRAHEWPKDAAANAKVSLAYSRALQIYHQSYSWEIRKREKISGKDSFDLKKMTSNEIYQEAYAGFERAWKVREELGKKSRDSLPDMISPNNYPKEVRGTLRDTLTYIIAGFLNDSSGWSTQYSNSTYTLDVDDLLTKKLNVTLGSDVHPVQKMAFVLRDLEGWHKSQGNDQAALEARLEIYRNLWEHLTSVSAQKKIKAALEKTIESNKKNPWVSMAYATLSYFNNEDGKIAYQWAKKGSQIFTNSPGAANCRDIIKAILMPALSLEGMNIDTSSKKSIAVNYKNIRKVYFRSFRIDFKDFIHKTKDYSLRPGWRELDKVMNEKPAYSWESEVPETTDYKQHRFSVTPPAHSPGFYAVMASNDTSFRDGIVHGIELFFSDHIFQLSRDYEKQEFHLQVLKGKDGQPVKEANVSLYRADYHSGHAVQDAKKTDNDGMVIFKTKTIKDKHNAFFFVVEKDGHLVGSRNPEGMYASGRPETKVTNAFIYTDRSIYRPLQKVLWKVVAYRGDNAKKNYQVDSAQLVSVQLHDGNGEIVQKASVKTNSFGSASGEFSIPNGKLLGNWSLSTTHGGGASIKVEEYKRPTFLVEFDDKANEIRLNREAILKGKAKYYFGSPLTKGSANWTIYRQANLPWWCFWGSWSWGDLQNNEFIASGKSSLKENGSFEIKFTPVADEDVSDVKDISYNYQVKADVTDEGGETRSADFSQTIGFSAVKAILSTGEKFFVAGEKSQINILRMDLNGRALSGKGTWKLVKLKNPEKTLTPSEIPVPQSLFKLSKARLIFPDDMKQPRWTPEYRHELYLREWKDEEKISAGEAIHGKDGKFILSLPLLKEGAYRLTYETKDSFNTTFAEQKEILVVGKQTEFPVPGLLLIQRASVEPGEKLRIYATSGFKNQRMVLDTFKSGKKVSSRILTSGKDETLIEIPVKENDRGGLGFSLSILNDFQNVRFTEYVMIPWSNKLVDIEFSTFRDKIRPGDKETWNITIKGKNGRKIGPETFELLAYMYDQSLDSFGPHVPPSPVGIFPTGGGTNLPESELGPATQVYTNLSYVQSSNEFIGFTPDHVKFYPNYGIGGPGSRGGGFELTKARSMKDSSLGSMALEGMAADVVNVSEAPQAMAKKASAPSPSKAEPAPVEMRTNFAETAFWKPHLVPGKDGSVKLEFTVPDSVTSWQVWAHAISKDLQSGSSRKETRTIKELMIRPYLPRFFREGDQAEIKVVINNSSDKELQGNVLFDILADDEKKSLNQEFSLSENEMNFSVKGQGSTTVTVPIKVPVGVKNIVIKTIARAGNISDGETRPLPVLPGRMHLAESKFVTLINKDKAELSFPGLYNSSDKTLVNDLFVVTLDAQLFYSVLSSLPYLVNYPYQCTEQMLNSFVSSGIMSSVFSEFPEMGKMAKELSSRKTRLESWNDLDPNRKLTLEEAPWLNLSRGSSTSEDLELMTVLHPDIAKNTRDIFLKQLRDSQTSSGGFPWFSGGPPSPWITMHLLYGFSKAIEFQVDVPKDMITKAWGYLHQHYVNEIVRDLMAHNTGWEIVTFLNYVLSNYPASWTDGIFTDAEKTTMLNFSMKHWKNHSPYLKSYLALTLSRAKRASDAKLVWESVMDSAKTSKDEGTHWAQEDRSWLWYNDTIETHALALRTGLELGTRKDTLDGLVQWLFLNKKLNHWKSTRATSEVIYSLTHYLKKTKQLGVKEKISVRMNGQTTNFEFDPDKYTGKKNQIVVPGENVTSKTVPVTVEKSTTGMAFASATWHYSTEKLPLEAVGDFFKVNRKYYRRVADKSEIRLIPVRDNEDIFVGDEVEVHLALSSKHQAEYVHLKDPRPSGFEPVDQVSKHKYDLGIYWYEEIRDSGTNFFFERLPHGQYNFRYRIRASMAGKFRAGPATIQPLYAPEFVGLSEGHELKIKQQK